MPTAIDRRGFLKLAGLGAAAATGGLTPPARLGAAEGQEPFKISLAQWSLHKGLFAKKVDPLDFAKIAQENGCTGIEYVNQFYKGKAKDKDYTAQMKKRADDLGIKHVLIMCDGEGALGDPDAKKRQQAVENHHKWVELAKYLGCHSIRVNAQSRGPRDEQMKLAADGLRKLTEFGAEHEINVIVENHGGLSSHGDWLVGVMKLVNHPRCGTLPDFGNFYEYDRYQGVAEMMPYAKGVSAKSYDFDAAGNETKVDYPRMMKIVLDAGYHGFVGIEYEGNRLSEDEGIKATKRLLDRIRSQVAK